MLRGSVRGGRALGRWALRGGSFGNLQVGRVELSVLVQGGVCVDLFVGGAINRNCVSWDLLVGQQVLLELWRGSVGGASRV